MIEIERKYTVQTEKLLPLLPTLTPVTIRQGYLSDGPDGKTIRVRTKGANAFLTIKGKTEGISRSEFEYEIPVEDAIQLLEQFCPKSLYKDRYTLLHDGKTWEIDVFHQALEGLIVAEVELNDETETVALPEWVLAEVSDDHRYFNVFLINSKWENGELITLE